MVGSAIVRRLESEGHTNLIVRSRSDLDLTCQSSVADFFEAEKPDYVFLAAAKVGGISANRTYPAEFIYENLRMELNVVHEAWCCGVNRLLFLGSSCIYPKLAPQPLREEYLLTGPLEPTNRAYALAKIAGVELCWSYNREHRTRFVGAMPTNLYGLGDNYDLDNSHVIPANPQLSISESESSPWPMPNTRHPSWLKCRATWRPKNPPAPVTSATPPSADKSKGEVNRYTLFDAP